MKREYKITNRAAKHASPKRASTSLIYKDHNLKTE
jgi:hypothetical protein